MARAIRSPMQWRPSNRKLSVCLTRYEIKKRKVTLTLTAEHGNLYFFEIHLNLEQHLADYRGNSFTYSGHF